MNIYLIDDSVQKVCFLQEILSSLNEGRGSSEKEFVDGFRDIWNIEQVTPEWVKHAGPSLKQVESEIDKVLCDADILLRAVNDKNGVCLIDIQLPKDCQKETGKEIILKLNSEGQDEVTKTYDEIMEKLGSHSDYQLAAVLLSLCKHNNIPCFIISTAVYFESTRLTDPNLGFKQLMFPDYLSSDNSRRIKDIAVALRSLIMTPLSVEEFLIEVEQLSHSDIDKGGKANQLLKQFLRLNQTDFIKYFCTSNTTDLTSGQALKSEVKDALKTISGLTVGETKAYIGKSLCLNGAWLLALGKYQEHFEDRNWTKVFSIKEFACRAKNDNQFPPLHPQQKNQLVRRQTILLFCEMCEELFCKRGKLTEPVLEKVILKPLSLSFILNFPCIKEDGRSLANRIALEARYARGETNVEEDQIGHSTSQSIWRFWVSCSFSDELNREEGVFGVQPRMNIYELDDEKTEVRFE
jgi:hypothetical protein